VDFSLRRVMSDFNIFAKGYTRSRVGLFFALILPIILIVLFGAIFSGGNSGPLPVYVQNQDSGTIGSSFVAALNSTNVMRVTLVPNSDNLSQYLLANSASDGIIIPANFSSSYLAKAPVNVTIYGNPTSSSSAIISGVTAAVINQFNLRRVGASPIIGIDSLKISSQSFKYIDFLVPGLIGFSILTSPMFSLVNISSEYKRDKIFKQLSLTPLTKTEWLLSKILWYVLLTIISFILMTVFGIYLFGAHITLSVQLLPFLLLGPFFFVSLGMLVGTVSKSVESASVVGNLVTFPMMFLSGTFFPVSSMPQYLQTFARVLPLYYVIDGLNNVMIYENTYHALIDLAVVAVVSAVVFVLAVRFFKWRED
jgi:ABC-2 type transport system permease protein